MEIKKIIIIGISNSGKTTALKHINNDENIEILSFDYGKTIIDSTPTYLFSSPGIGGFKSINDIISPDVDGIIVFIDNTIGITETDAEIIDFIDKQHIPYIIFANKQDLSSSILRIDFDTHIIPTIATEGIGINDGLKMLLKLVENTSKPKISQKNENKNINEPTKSNNQNIEPKKDFKDIIKSIKSPNKEDPRRNLKDLVKKIKPVNEKDEGEVKICKLKLFMHPIELENVKTELENAGFSNITLIEVGYVDNHSVTKESYRGSNYNINIPQKVEINMILKQEDVKYVIQTIESIKTEDIIDDIFISPIENVVRIRTEEKGEEAIE